jgi:hypothetical protein
MQKHKEIRFFFFQILGLVDMVSKKNVAPKKNQT